jgi:hypothetical protein
MTLTIMELVVFALSKSSKEYDVHAQIHFQHVELIHWSQCVLIGIFQLASGAISCTLTVQIEICHESNLQFSIISSVADFIAE